jgi:CheY-like chemotaxis protein
MARHILEVTILGRRWGPWRPWRDWHGLQRLSITMADARRPRVLVIDDDPSVREVVQSLLASFGYECQTAADGRSGITRFDEEGGWDLVLTDLAMPEMSGWEVVAAIRRRAPTMPIVVITGLNDSDVMQRATEWRLPVLTKPLSAQTLKAAVVEALYRKPA